MAKTKISTLARELNVGLPTVYSFLSEKGISIEDGPNTRVEGEIVDLLVSKFAPDKEFKQKTVRPAAPAPAPAPKEPARTEVLTSETSRQPRILGKIDLDAKGNPVVRKPEPAKPALAAEPAKSAPVEKAEVKPAAPVAEPEKKAQAPAAAASAAKTPAEPKAEKPAAAAPAPKPSVEAPKAEAPKPVKPTEKTAEKPAEPAPVEKPVAETPEEKAADE